MQWNNRLKDLLDDVFLNLEQIFPDGVKVAISSFIDKPLPFRSPGMWYGNWEVALEDRDHYCYQVDQPFGKLTSAHKTRLKNAVRDLYNLSPWKGDAADNSYEAVIRAVMDPTLGWTDYQQPTNDEQHAVVRMVILMTDNLGHLQGDAQEAIDIWNQPRGCWDQEGEAHVGGFGSLGFAQSGSIYFASGSKDQMPGSDYYKYMQLCDAYASTETEWVAPWTDEELFAIMKDYYGLFGPETMPDLYPAVEAWDDPCLSSEYPSLEQVADALTKHQTYLSIIVSGTKSDEIEEYCTNMYNLKDGVSCVAFDYEAKLKQVCQLVSVQTTNIEKIGATLRSLAITAAKTTCAGWEPPSSSTTTGKPKPSTTTKYADSATTISDTVPLTKPPIATTEPFEEVSRSDPTIARLGTSAVAVVSLGSLVGLAVIADGRRRRRNNDVVGSLSAAIEHADDIISQEE